MGHIGQKALQMLQQRTIGCEINTDRQLNCEVCTQAKATAIISRKPATRTDKYLDKVYSDICGPITPETWSKSRYFASFIDDHTRWVDIALLRTKDQIFKEFNDWLIRVQNQSNTTLKRFHSDNAPEYKSEQFKDLYLKQGIIGTYSAPYTPEQNGASEIFNRTLISKVRSMLIKSQLPKAYWGEAATAAVYIYNRTPHSSLEGYITPYEAKTDQKPDISHIRTWGSIAYKKEPSISLKKLDPRANPYILVGYGSNQYRLINPKTRQSIWARDVYIYEGKFLSDLQGQLFKELPPITDLQGQLVTEPQDTNTQDNYLSSFIQELYDYAELVDEIAIPAIEEPNNLEEVKASKDSKQWYLAIQKELNELKRQNTWDLVPLPPNRKPLKGRWVLKIKYPPEGEPIYKARWVAKGFQQRFGIDFNETYANTVNPVAYRLILALAAHYDWEIYQWDVKSAYPNATLTETVYVQQPTGFEDPNNPTYVCQLKKALYGLKQSAREWETFLKKLLGQMSLIPLKIDQSVYISRDPDDLLILITYVDDILAIAKTPERIQQAYNELNKVIIINNLGPANIFLGIEISRDRPKGLISLHQETYTRKILKRFNKQINLREDPTTPGLIGQSLEPNTDEISIDIIKKYQQEVGSLIYLMTKTRPDLAYPIGLLARFMANPGPQHFKALERVWKYIGQTPNLGLLYQSTPTSLLGYCDADWGGDIGTRRSTTGYIYLYRGTAISWNSKLQKTVALSSCEAEYMALKEAIKEQLYIRALTKEIPYLRDLPSYTLYTDSHSAIELAKNPLFHYRTKHVDIQYHFVRENVQNQVTLLEFIPTEGQLADALTKTINQAKWLRFIKAIGLNPKNS
jgi:hypothetical protein